MAELVRQVKDMSDHFLALSWRLDLQEQTLSLRLCEAQSGELQSSDGGKAWPGVERRPRRTYGRCSREWTACPGR